MKRTLSLLLVLLMCLSLLPLAALAEEANLTEPVVEEKPILDGVISGTYDKNITWTLEGTTLTISGSGPLVYIPENSDLPSGPWYGYTIKTVIINSGVTSISGRVFHYFSSSLTSVTLPVSITSITDEAFAGCTSLESIELPNRVTCIDDAFRGCTSLTSITIPDSVASMNGAFRGCTSLTSVTIPDSVTSMDYAFYDCTSLTSVTIPDSVTSIAYAFENCTSLTSVTIPSGVTRIGECAFCDCTSLTNVTIPSSVTKIGEYAFCNCTSLTDVTIPDRVTSIEGWAFYGCSSLTSVTFPDCLTTIWDCAFQKCTSLTSVTIPNSVTGIYYAFAGCTGLTSVTIDMETVPSCFGGLTSLKEITFGEHVTSIGNSAFRGCTGLTSVTIPDSVTKIGENAFCNCTSLTDVTIPDRVTSIEGGAFYGCTGLTSVTIPNSVMSIGDYAFCGCTSLTAFNASEDSAAYSSLDGILFNKDKTTLIWYPAAKSQTEYVVPESVTRIKTYAFSDCDSIRLVIGCDSAVKDWAIGKGFTEASGDSPISGKQYRLLHNTTITDPAVAATCTETGLTEGSHCVICGKTLIAREVVPANGHTTVTDEAVEPTCTAVGLTEGSHCSVCGKVFVAQRIIPANGHTEQLIPGKEATCSEAGLTEGKKCSVCGAILSAQSMILPTEHTPGKAVRENEVAATYETEGSYDKVVYCTVCHTELSRTTKTIKKLQPDQIKNATIKLSQTTYTYDGETKTPAVTVKLDGKKLTKDVDYTVKYGRNKNAGTATVRVTGIGAYSGSKTANFTIRKAKNTITASSKYASYSKKAQKIDLGASAKAGGLTYTSSDSSVTVKKGVVTLPKGFTGTVTITISGKATKNYKAPKDKTVTVTVLDAPAITSITSDTAKKLTATWSKVAGATGYELEYTKAKKFATASDTVTLRKTAKTLSKLSAGKIYRVRVRAYKTLKSGETVYSAWSEVGTVKIAK